MVTFERKSRQLYCCSEQSGEKTGGTREKSDLKNQWGSRYGEKKKVGLH